MAALPSSESNAIGTALVVALVLVLATQLAWWTWRFVAADLRIASSRGTSAVDLDAVARMLGATHAPLAGASSSSLHLKGVIAPTPGSVAAAIFGVTNGRDVAVLPGNEIVSGVKLAEVHPDYVIVTRAGVRERIDLDVHQAKVATAPGGRTAPGFHLDVSRGANNDFTFARKDLDTALRDPGQLSYLGQIGIAPGGGVRLDAAPPGSLAAKLGLQPGDVIRRVNGQSISSPGDLARLYQQFGTIDAIQAEVERGGRVERLAYRIQ
jgi:general secretion pathway protein C